jgi:hypothetical protein
VDRRIRQAIRDYGRDGWTIIIQYKPDNFSKRWFYFDMGDYPSRPSREMILADLRVKLDVKDYHSEP